MQVRVQSFLYAFVLKIRGQFNGDTVDYDVDEATEAECAQRLDELWHVQGLTQRPVRVIFLSLSLSYAPAVVYCVICPLWKSCRNHLLVGFPLICTSLRCPVVCGTVPHNQSDRPVKMYKQLHGLCSDRDTLRPQELGAVANGRVAEMDRRHDALGEGAASAGDVSASSAIYAKIVHREGTRYSDAGTRT